MASSSSSSTEEQYIEFNKDDLKENQMKEFPMPQGGSVLVINQGGTFSAVGSKCTHYGAPLEKGVLHNGRLRCQWHGACFNATTGDIEDYPGLDSLACYDISVDSKGQVKVNLSKKDSGSPHLQPKSETKEQVVLIIGGGPAAQTCAEVLRNERFMGRIIMATKEKIQPYDRTKLSKAMDVNMNAITLRSEEFLSNANIELWTNKEATGIDILQKKVEFQDHATVGYDHLVIATGGRPNKRNVPGNGLGNVCLLRNPVDAKYIHQASIGKDVIIDGASFIGLEVASYLVDKAKSVTVIARSTIPFQTVFGMAIGKRIKELFEENGVAFKTDVAVAKYEGNDGKVTHIVLDNGEHLKADVAVVGLGITPATDFLSGSGIPLTKNGFVIVNSKMETEVKNVYAAGDAVQFPLFLYNDVGVSIGHWQMAQAHGRTAALNILQKNSVVRSIPYFWTMLFKKSIRCAGYGVEFDDVFIDGDLKALQFVAYYIRNGYVVAAASMNMDPIVSKFAEYLNGGNSLKANELKKNPKSWLSTI